METRVTFNPDDSLPMLIRPSNLDINEESNSSELTAKEVHLLAALDFLDGLNDEEYLTCVDAITRDCKHLQLENVVMNVFFKIYEPHVVQDLPKILNLIEELEQESPLMPAILNQQQIPKTPLEVKFSDTGERLNVQTRQDILVRYEEEMQTSLTKFVNKKKRERFELNAKIEESGIRIDEINEAAIIFEESMQAAVDPITQRIPAEKFIWFLQEWMKSARQLTEKFRLRNIALRGAYKKAKASLEERIEIGQTLHSVDFDRYQLHNRILTDKMLECNVNLKQLKRFNGEANLDLTTSNSYLQNLVLSIKRYKAEIDKCAKDTVKFEKEREKAEKSLNEVKMANRKVKELIAKCKAPDILEYLRVKAHLLELTKVKKILERKEYLMNITVDTNKKMIMNLTGMKKFDKHWFDECIRIPESEEEDGRAADHRNILVEPLACSSSTEGEFDIFNVIKMSPSCYVKMGDSARGYTHDSIKPRKLPRRFQKSILK